MFLQCCCAISIRLLNKSAFAKDDDDTAAVPANAFIRSSNTFLMVLMRLTYLVKKNEGHDSKGKCNFADDINSALQR